MEHLKLLKEFVLFYELSEQELEKIASKITEKTYADGEVICRQGELGCSLYLLKQGTVVVKLPLYRYKYDNKYEVVANLSKGMFFGELSFFDGKKYSSDVYANSKVELLELNRTDFDSIIFANPKKGYNIQEKIIKNLVRTIREINERYSLNVVLR
jgi:CRP-like cAMP-binding protein